MFGCCIKKDCSNNNTIYYVLTKCEVQHKHQYYSEITYAK